MFGNTVNSGKNYGKFTGFTLAEVLITLGIIGVVSAITMPALIKKYQEHVTVNKVKKLYSMVSQAVLLSISQNGPADEWNVSDDWTPQSAEEFASYIVPYLKIVKDCGTEAQCFDNTDEIKNLNGIENRHIEGNNKYYKIILSDGTYMWIRGSASNYCKENQGYGAIVCGELAFDTNGAKEPNTLGKDIFVIPVAKHGTKTQDISKSCYKNSVGWSCLSWILINNNMNYPETKPEE